MLSLSKHDSNWPARYEKERRELLRLFGGTVDSIEHVGSTAIPGIDAKPVIDIMMGVKHLDDFLPKNRMLEDVGYTWGHGDVVEADWRFYVKYEHSERAVHLHVVHFKGDFWDRTILFRDYLRSHPETAAEYQALKRRLVVVFAKDRVRYVAAKSEFVDGVVRLARDERGHQA